MGIVNQDLGLTCYRFLFLLYEGFIIWSRVYCLGG
jgi:hypothetical protein